MRLLEPRRLRVGEREEVREPHPVAAGGAPLGQQPPLIAVARVGRVGEELVARARRRDIIALALLRPPSQFEEDESEEVGGQLQQPHRYHVAHSIDMAGFTESLVDWLNQKSLPLVGELSPLNFEECVID